MHRIRLILGLLLFSMVLPTMAATDSPTPKFSAVYNWNNFEYTLLTPEILELMPDKISEKDLGGIPASKLKLVEIVKTQWHGKSKDLKEIVKSVTSEPGWTQVSVQKKENNNTIWYIKKGGGDKIREILILKYSNWDSGFYALYLVGSMTTEDLKKLFK